MEKDLRSLIIEYIYLKTDFSEIEVTASNIEKACIDLQTSESEESEELKELTHLFSFQLKSFKEKIISEFLSEASELELVRLLELHLQPFKKKKDI